jgi:hypothetical protein
VLIINSYNTGIICTFAGQIVGEVHINLPKRPSHGSLPGASPQTPLGRRRHELSCLPPSARLGFSAHTKARAKRATGVWGVSPPGRRRREISSCLSSFCSVFSAHTKARAKRATGGLGGWPPSKKGRCHSTKLDLASSAFLCQPIPSSAFL